MPTSAGHDPGASRPTSRGRSNASSRTRAHAYAIPEMEWEAFVGFGRSALRPFRTRKARGADLRSSSSEPGRWPASSARASLAREAPAVTLAGAWAEGSSRHRARRGVRVEEDEGAWTIPVHGLSAWRTRRPADLALVLVKSHNTPAVAPPRGPGPRSPRRRCHAPERPRQRRDPRLVPGSPPAVIVGVTTAGATLLGPGHVRGFAAPDGARKRCRRTRRPDRGTLRPPPGSPRRFTTTSSPRVEQAGGELRHQSPLCAPRHAERRPPGAFRRPRDPRGSRPRGPGRGPGAGCASSMATTLRTRWRPLASPREPVLHASGHGPEGADRDRGPERCGRAGRQLAWARRQPTNAWLLAKSATARLSIAPRSPASHEYGRAPHRRSPVVAQPRRRARRSRSHHGLPPLPDTSPWSERARVENRARGREPLREPHAVRPERGPVALPSGLRPRQGAP